MHEHTKGIILFVTALFIFALNGILAKGINASPLLLLFAMAITGAPIFFVLALKNKGLNITPQNIKGVIVIALLALVVDFAFFSAVKVMPIANAVFIKFTYPLLVILLAPLILEEHFQKDAFRAVLVGVGGLLLILLEELVFSINLAGALFAFTAAITLAFFVVLVKKLLIAIEIRTILFYRYFISVFILFPFVYAEQSWKMLNTTLFLSLLGFGILFAALAMAFHHEGIKRITAQKASALSYLEPLAAAIYAYLIFSETLSVYAIAGGTLILVSGFLLRWR